MPGVYREKVCPACGIKHRKRGEYCSKTCSNKDRDPQVYEKVSQFMKSDRGQELTYRLHNDPDYDPPVVGGFGKSDDGPKGVIIGGDFWTSDDSW